MFTVILSQRAQKQKNLLRQAGLDGKARLLLDLLRKNPYQTPPSYEKLRGDLAGLCSRRINRQHRLVYEVNEEKKEVFVLSMWTYYE